MGIFLGCSSIADLATAHIYFVLLTWQPKALVSCAERQAALQQAQGRAPRACRRMQQGMQLRPLHAARIQLREVGHPAGVASAGGQHRDSFRDTLITS